MNEILHQPPSINKMQFFLLVSTVITLTAAAPERQGRAAPEYESVCKASAEAYSKAKAEGKPAKIAGVIAAKTFYVGFFNSKISGIVPACKNTVDATQSKSVASMVKYFNTATSNDLNVVTPICKAATVAYFNAKIDGKTPDEAKLAAAGAYVPLLLKDLGADPGEACIKSQDYINN